MEPTLVVADLHADPKALEVVLAAVRDEAFEAEVGRLGRVAVLGDVVGRGSAPGPLLERLRRWNGSLVAVRGNHEEVLLEEGRLLAGGELARRAHRRLIEDEGVRRWLADLPVCAVLDDGILMVHGGPVDPALLDGDVRSRRTWQRLEPPVGPAADGYHVPLDAAFDAVEDAVGPEGVLLCGHEHRELLRERVDGRIRVPEATAFDVETAAGTVTGRRVPRGGRPVLARVGMGATGPKGPRFGVVTDEAILLAGLAER